MIFKLENEKIKKISKKEFKQKKDLQRFIEMNLEDLLELEFVKSEFTIKEYKFDTLAFDKENNAFVIIKYKKDSNYSVIDQGYSYLATMLNNKAEIILKFNELFNSSIKITEINWSHSKIIFISQNFTKYQRSSLNFRDFPIELYEVIKYDDDLLFFEKIKGKQNLESVKTSDPTNKKTSLITKKITKEIKPSYTLENHYKNSTDETVELFMIFKEKIEEIIPNIKLEPKKLYIAFKNNNKNIIDIRLQKTSLKFWLNANKGTLRDSKNIMKDVSNLGHWGNGDYQLTIDSDEHLEYILSLIKQVYNLNQK